MEVDNKLMLILSNMSIQRNYQHWVHKTQDEDNKEKKD